MAGIGRNLNVPDNLRKYFKNKGEKQNIKKNWFNVAKCNEEIYNTYILDSVRYIPKKGGKLKFRFLYSTQLLFPKYLPYLVVDGKIIKPDEPLKTYRKAHEWVIKVLVPEYLEPVTVESDLNEFLLPFETSKEFGEVYKKRITPLFFWNKMSENQDPKVTVYRDHFDYKSNKVCIAFNWLDIFIPSFVDNKPVDLTYNEDKTVSLGTALIAEQKANHLTPLFYSFYNRVHRDNKPLYPFSLT